MAAMLEYLSWRGDLTFSERAFNEVDNLILSELAYFDFGAFVREDCNTLGQIADAFLRAGIPMTYGINDPIPVLRACGESARFSDVVVRDFVNIVDENRQIQFSAVSYFLPDGEVYVAFRGTDNTIVGWREDCNISFMDRTPAQSEAVKYLSRVLSLTERDVMVGGHSKGGNLAVYAAAFCPPALRRKIGIVYSNDGPGFNQRIASSEEYKSVLPKVKLIIPESSVIGIIFSLDTEKEIIESSAEGAYQHNPLSWIVECDHFKRADRQTSSSLIIDETLRNWMNSLDYEQRKLFFSTVFDVLEASGAKTLTQMNSNKLLYYNAIAKAAAAQGMDAKENFHETMKKLAIAGRDALINETKKLYEPHIPKLEESE